MHVGVIDSEYRGKIGVILFNHSIDEFHVQVGYNIAQLILVKIINPVVQKVKALSAIQRERGGFVRMGLQSGDYLVLGIQREKKVKRNGKIRKRGNVQRGYKINHTPRSPYCVLERAC